MADKKDPKKVDKPEEAPSELTEEQRIAALEKSASTNKLVLLGLSLFLLIFVSVTVTSFILLASKGGDPRAQKEAFAALQGSLEKQSLQLEALDARLLEHSLRLSELTNELARSGNVAMATIAVEQEQNYQTFLASLRSATYDLAHMVPGSRAWLELYSAQIDSAVEQSKVRQSKLEKVKLEESSKKTEKDPFFGD